MFEDGPFPWREVLEALSRRRRTILFLTAIGFGLALLSVLTRTPVYKAEATLALRAQRGSVKVSPDSSSAVTVDGVSQRELAQQQEMLRSPQLARQVLERHQSEAGVVEEEQPSVARKMLGWVTSPGQLLGAISKAFSDAPVESEIDKRVPRVLAALEVEPVPRADMIRVSYQDADPERAADFTNLYLQTHIERSLGLGSDDEARTFLREQRELALERLNRAKGELDAYRQERRVSHLPDNPEELRRDLSALQEQYSAAQTSRREVQARETYLTEAMGRTPARIRAELIESESETVQTLRTHLLELELERTDLLSRYAPGSTVVRDLDRRLDEVRERLAREERITSETRTAVNPSYQNLEVQLLDTRAQLATLDARVGSLEGQMARRQVELARLQSIAPELDRLRNVVEGASAAYQNYLRKEEEARFALALDESRILNVSVLESAVAPTRPMSSSSWITLLAVTGTFFFLSLLIALLRDWIDPTLKSAGQVERVAGYPVIAEISS